MHLRFKMAVPPHPGAKPVPKQNEMRAGLNRQTIRSTRFGGNKKNSARQTHRLLKNSLMMSAHHLAQATTPQGKPSAWPSA